jgi:peptidoglycan/xylan/chitin deacetylase (PgdA/CDA1 family)
MRSLINHCKFIPLLFLLFFLSVPSEGAVNKGVKVAADAKVPILLYHRFGPVVADSMTVTTPVFESNLKYLRKNGYTIIPLRQLVNYYLGHGQPAPPKSVVITADDGHKSVYADMFPLIRKYQIPVTLFIYPSAISNASYAMTWKQLREMKKSGLVDIQSHTYWHPNFKKDRRRLSPSAYRESVDMQLRKSKEKLEKELGTKVDMLAWPFGIHDEDLEKEAATDGYLATFTMVRRHSGISDDVMALPRYLMTDRDRGKVFGRLLLGR